MHAGSPLLELQQTLYRSANPTRRWLHCSRRDWIVAALGRHAGARGRALEVGPGSGLYLPLLAALFREAYAADIEPAYLDHARELARRHPNLHPVVDDIARSRLPAGSFDLILCSEVVEHLAESAAAIAGMRRLLRPGGVLVLSTPQRYSPLELAARIAFLPGIIDLVRAIYREPILKTGHINLMTAGRLRAQVEGAGLLIGERHASGVYLPVVAEFGGTAALRLEQWCEARLRGGPFDWLLWTQYVVATAPQPGQMSRAKASPSPM